ncbi:LuxR family transcriptional regulator [Cellulomonas sp. WB94]|uniref:helix-turn-helix transcriptional regulator n=1 Tax=Cellulomonas sp. WB94 TaxID=2173174 RepID=UPI000D56B3D0|nr:helix-turn-helix transcriptional regulator [Cellulomonas sp. WB94]PVU83059.1 LuxR family transcriptional regulator [Cellulomonas sp. WB94]
MAARRLQADRVAVVFSARDGTTPPFRHDGVPSLTLGPLDAASARALLDERTTSPIHPDVAHQLLEQTAANALALVELAPTLSPAQLAGDSPLGSHLPMTPDMERVFLDRARRLPEQVQSYLLLVAADDSGQLRSIARAAAILGLDEATAGAAEASGLVTTDDDTLRVRHPLVRSALYQAASSRERRAAHRALAAALDGQDPDRQAWHRAAAAEGPDETLASALDAAGTRAENRGGYAAASRAYERAAELTAGAARRAERYFAAARNAWDGGELARARALTATARNETDDPVLRADIDRLRGRVEVNVGSSSAAHRIYVNAAAAVARHDPDRAVDLAVAARGLAAYGGDSGVALAPETLSTQPIPGESARTRSLRQLLKAMTAASEGRWSDGLDLFRECLADGVTDAHPDVLAHFGQAALYLGDDEAAERCFETMLGGAREKGAGMTALYALPRLAFPLFVTGQWSRVERCAHEARSLAASTGQPALSATPLAWLALLAAVRGHELPAVDAADLDEVVEHRALGILAGPTADLRRWSAGVRDAHAGSLAGAHHHLSRMRLPALTRLAALDRIGAAARAGEVEWARAQIDDLVPFAEATRWPWALGAVHHGRALLATAEDAPHLFEASLVHYSTARRPYDLARTHLAFGEHLRRAQQRVEARAHLRRALEIFDDLNAGPAATRAANELRASGETARKRDVSTQLALTPMELQVARLVAQGLSNKDVAAQCWISPRTVAFHLRNCFAKTGVSSRGELAQVVLS